MRNRGPSGSVVKLNGRSGTRTSKFAKSSSKVAGKDVGKQSPYGKDWAQRSKQARSRDNYRCSVCGWKPKKAQNKRYLHAHHKQSRSKGGSNALYNLETECLDCHSKSHKHMAKASNVLWFIANKHKL